MLGNNIRAIRKAKKISINRLSELTGISLGYLSDLENNKASNPTTDKLNKIAEVLGTPVTSFFDEDFIEDYTISDTLINTLSGAAGVSYKDFYKLTGTILLYSNEVNRLGALEPVFKKHIIKKVAENPKTRQFAESFGRLELSGIVRSISYEAFRRTIAAEINFPEGPDAAAGQGGAVSEIYFDLPALDETLKASGTTFTLAAHRTAGYDEPLTEDEAAAVKAFLETYRKMKHKKED